MKVDNHNNVLIAIITIDNSKFFADWASKLLNASKYKT